ncbi:hypothetical protein L2E82_28616 [Cichorium intybus]|uniref:Uncharacterized protein n=1 Tax=Cichorium intybus TaxID=13427 RepID=A0ACB9CW81_CICIN|nr:hypothetical protein L2E82_28616 [Cichorium intybus]
MASSSTGMASSSNAKDLNAEGFDEEDDDDYVPSSDESTEFSDDDFGSDMSGVSIDPDENQYIPSTMDKTLVDPFLNDLTNIRVFLKLEKPLITMLEEIRLYVMERFDAMKRGKDSWKSEVAPRILQKMKKWHTNMRNWIVFPSGPVLEVRNGRGKIKKCHNCLQEGHNTRTCKNEKIVPPMKEKKPPGRPKNPNSEERRKRKKASETSGGKATETSGGKGKKTSETRQNVGEQGVPPMQFPESQVDEGVPLTQEGVSETQETVPETQFKQVPVVDVALVEAGNKEDQGHVLHKNPRLSPLLSISRLCELGKSSAIQVPSRLCASLRRFKCHFSVAASPSSLKMAMTMNLALTVGGLECRSTSEVLL